MNKFIDLKKIPITIATVPWNQDRHKLIAMQLKMLGLQEPKWLFGDKTSPYWTGAKQTYLEALNQEPPFLILEDDATLLEYNYNQYISVPEECDVIYLGGTRNAENIKINSSGTLYRTKKGTSGSGLIFSPYNDLYVRIYNMHSSHSILILNNHSKNLFINAGKEINKPIDVCFALSMQNCKTLLRRNPFWFQNDGRNNELTINCLNIV